MVVLCALLSPQPEGTGGGRDTGSARRAVARFDFEESDFNPDPVPQFWFRAQDDPAVPRSRPGFPRFNEAIFDRAAATSGTWSVKLPTQGGSTSLRLMPGTIPVFPDADYAVTAKVRTSGLKHARAAVTARLLTQGRTPVPGSDRRSELVLSDDAWRDITIVLATDHGEAAFLQIDLELLQASQFGDGADAPPGRIAFEDISGAAWFDDVCVDLIPRAGLRTLSPGNLVPAGQKAVLEYRIRDLVAQSLTAHLRVFDADGSCVAEQEAAVSSDGRVNTWTPGLPGFGPYRARLEIRQGERVIERRETAFVWCAPIDHPLGPVGLIIDRPAGAGADWESFVPAAVRATGAGAVWMSLPSGSGLSGAAPVEQALASGAQLTLVIPPELSRAVGEVTRPKPASGGPPEAPPTPPSAQASSLLESLDRFGQRVTRWGVGDGGGETVRPLLKRFVPGPIVSWVRTLGDTQGVPSSDALVLKIPTSIAPADLPGATTAFLRATGGAPSGGVTLALDTGLSAQGGARGAANDFVRRAVHAWRLLGSYQDERVLDGVTLALESPWAPGDPVAEGVGAPEPRPEVAVLGTVGARLHNRRIVGEFEVAPGVSCFILQGFDSQRADKDAVRGCLVAWNDSGGEAVLAGYFGSGPIRVIDVFGNTTPAPRDPSGTYLRVPIGPSPVFIEPIDPELARLVSGFRVDPAAAPAVIAAHEHELVLDNPWPEPMAGEIRIISPSAKDRWDVSPSSAVGFSAPGGGRARVPVTLSFPPDQESGDVPVIAVITLRSPVSAPPVHVVSKLTIGLLDLSFNATAARSPGVDGPDVVINVNIKNQGSRERTLRLDASAPGRATSQYSISNLAPGETVVRRFVLKGAGAQLAGKRVRLSLSDVETPERLNRGVIVP
jgi:hypothetical protein